MPADARFHKGVLTHFRTQLKRAGLFLEAEMAQYVLAGRAVVMAPWQPVVDRVRHETFEGRAEASRTWEGDHPGANPFPPPFPQRVLDKIRDAMALCTDDADVLNIGMALETIAYMCSQEMKFDEEWEPPAHKS